MDFLAKLNTLGSVWFWIWLLGALALLAVFGALVHSVRRSLPAPKLESRPLLTPNETEFYGRLKRALPDFEIFAQVSMGALLKTNVSQFHPDFWALRKQFAQKIVDFVVVRRDAQREKTSVVVVIELDDRTHDPEKDAKRDAMLLSAGIRTLRYDSRAKPNEAQIAADVAALSRSS